MGGLDERAFAKLEDYLKRVPSISGSIGKGSDDSGWWVKFSIDIDSPIAWQTVQELGHVLNYLSIEERLPTTFQPVSPPPYMNGGPRDFRKRCDKGTLCEFSVIDQARRLSNGLDDERHIDHRTTAALAG